jgi:peptidoglycan hydrolase-like protein with peptidoglycan-binding domain
MRSMVVVCLVAVSLVGGTGANAAQPLLTLGSRGALVASWQRALSLWLSQSGIAADKRLGTRLGGNLVIDGVFGANTLAATRRFQQESHLRMINRSRIYA